MQFSDWSEALHWARQQDLVIGVDEVGRGCLAGPLVVAASSRSEDISGINIYFLAEDGQSILVYPNPPSPSERQGSDFLEASDEPPAHPENKSAALGSLASPGPLTKTSASAPSAASKTLSNPLDIQTLRSFSADWLESYLSEDTKEKPRTKGKPISLEHIEDSKKLSPQQRQKLSSLILKHFSISLVVIPPTLIDRVNILQATLLGMEQAVLRLRDRMLPIRQKHDVTRSQAFIDGPHVPKSIQAWSWPVIDGDALVTEISAASIVAKVFRDDWMKQLDTVYPGYSWASHKGYGTSSHLNALKLLGPTPMHRMSFAPVAEAAHNRMGQNPF